MDRITCHGTFTRVVERLDRAHEKSSCHRSSKKIKLTFVCACARVFLSSVSVCDTLSELQ